MFLTDEINVKRREKEASRVARLAKEFRDLVEAGRPKPNAPYAPPEEIEAYLIAKYRDKPCKLSPELKRKLGLSV